MIMNEIKIKYIIGPFKADPIRFTNQAIELSRKLVGQSYDEPVSVLSIHPGLLSGAYGDDTNEDERANGMVHTGNLLEYIAQQKQNELWIIGSAQEIFQSRGTQAEIYKWVETRKEYWPMNIFYWHIEEEK